VPLEGWPSAGICAYRQQGSKVPCVTLYAADGKHIERALQSYLRTEAAKRDFEPDYLGAATRASGEPFVSREADGQLSPRLGSYLVLADESGTLELRNTERVTPEGRWGFSFKLRRREAVWDVVDLGTWRAWHKR